MNIWLFIFIVINIVLRAKHHFVWLQLILCTYLCIAHFTFMFRVSLHVSRDLEFLTRVSRDGNNGRKLFAEHEDVLCMHSFAVHCWLLHHASRHDVDICWREAEIFILHNRIKTRKFDFKNLFIVSWRFHYSRWKFSRSRYNFAHKGKLYGWEENLVTFIAVLVARQEKRNLLIFEYQLTSLSDDDKDSILENAKFDDSSMVNET